MTTIEVASVNLGSGAVSSAFDELLDLSPDAWFMLPAHDTERMIVDGKFTLDELKRIVAAWEAFIEATERAQP